MSADALIEPGNHEGVVDRFDETWVRVDEHAGYWGDCNWWPITDSTGWEEGGRNKVGQSRPWSGLEDYRPLTLASAERTARALALVREWVAR